MTNFLTKPRKAYQAGTSHGRGRLAWWIAAVAMMAFGFVLRAAYYHNGYCHPDETITVEVVRHMWQSGDLDTNWKKAPTLRVDLRYDQYNFSSYLYATYWFCRLAKIVRDTLGRRSEDGGLWVYRFFSVLLATLVVVQVVRLGERSGGRGVALGAGLLVAVSVQLVQDAHYARPEAFVTALTLAVVVMVWPREKLSIMAVGGGAVMVGLLVACKVSMALLVWMPLVPVVAAWGGATRRGRLVALVSVPVGIVAGFAAGAPVAVVNPAVFVNGIEFLMNQYAGLHPPHSHLNGGWVADMLAAYFAATLGWPVLACGVLGVGVLARRRRWAELALVGGPVVLFAGYFATRTVFFERNLSHVLPLFLVLAAVGAVTLVEVIGRRGRAPGWAVAVVAFGLLALPALRVTGPFLLEEVSGAGADRHKAFEAALKENYSGVEWKEVMLLNDGPLRELAARLKADKTPVLLRVTDFNDEWNAYNLMLFDQRFVAKRVADYPGSFAHVPVCTLHTYHSPHNRYFLVTGLRGP
jgi:hypothetical protein